MNGRAHSLPLNGKRNTRRSEGPLTFPQIVTVPSRLSDKAASKACAEALPQPFISGPSLQFWGFPVLEAAGTLPFRAYRGNTSAPYAVRSSDWSS